MDLSIRDDQGRGKKRGRPSGLTRKRERLLFEAIKRGLPYKHAAALAGVSYASLNRWRQQGSKPDAPAEFCNFCNQLEAAEAQAVDNLLKIVSAAAAKRDWKAAAWMLERRHPEDFQKKEAGYRAPELPPENPLEKFNMSEEKLREIVFKIANPPKFRLPGTAASS
jgi:hypothetical protein